LRNMVAATGNVDRVARRRAKAERTLALAPRRRAGRCRASAGRRSESGVHASVGAVRRRRLRCRTLANRACATVAETGARHVLAGAPIPLTLGPSWRKW